MTRGWSALRSLDPTRRCALLLRGDMRCAWCGCELDPGDGDGTLPPAEIDHVEPRASFPAGTRPSVMDALSNLVGCCGACNQARKRREGIGPRLAGLGVSLASALARVEKQRVRDARRKGSARLAFPFGEEAGA